MHRGKVDPGCTFRIFFFGGGVASRVPWWWWPDSYGKMGNFGRVGDKVLLKCTKKLGYGGRVTFDNIFKSS